MASSILYDISQLDTARSLLSADEMNDYLPQTFEMRQLERVVHLDEEAGIIVGHRTVREEEFWVRGHIPGRPLLPGVLMIETAAQLCTVYYHMAQKAAGHDPAFIGLGAVDNVRFRAAIEPGQSMVFIARSKALRSRIATFETQAIANDKIVFEASITGVKV